MALGQLTHLPEDFAANPFSPLLARFSRLKAGSWEALFVVEAYLVRFSWLSLIVLGVLVWLPLDEVDYVSTLVRLATLIYPAFFVWSLTRMCGVELMQLVLEGQWTADVLATPLTNRALTTGLATPIWLTVRQYVLMTAFSLVLYGLETQPIVRDPETMTWFLDSFLRSLAFNCDLFFTGAAWILFLYMMRLFMEIRLRNGLLKGLATLGLLLSGAALVGVFLLLFTRYSDKLWDTRVLSGLALISSGLVVAAAVLYFLLRRHFRDYLLGHLDLDVLIHDELDPQASAWQTPDGAVRTGAPPSETHLPRD